MHAHRCGNIRLAVPRLAGLLYPAGLPQPDWLAHYATAYATVENNSTFHRLPARDTFADWRARTPARCR